MSAPRNSLKIRVLPVIAFGESPLTGMETGAWKARFPDQSEVYDPAMRNAIVQACRAGGFPAVEAVYAAVTGPTYETPSEVRALRGMGADIVGMSTVPEAMLANAFGMKTAAVSLVANFGAGISQSRLCHDDVLAMSRKAIPAMRRVLSAFLKTPVRTEV